MSFLIVDDNSVMRRTIRRVVGEFADEIVECNDGAEALAAYEKYLPDWVLMDVEMREKDGLTATREICAKFRYAKIIIVTKHGDAEMRSGATSGRVWICNEGKSFGITQIYQRENVICDDKFLRNEKERKL